ncbi:hypothetical protein Tco_0292996, partial [Tanacetum coccineum]
MGLWERVRVSCRGTLGGGLGLKQWGSLGGGLGLKQWGSGGLGFGGK